MQSKRLAVYLTGIAITVIAISIISTVSGIYFSTWYDFEQSKGVNTASVSGVTNTYGNGSNLLVNMTMAATYPKAVTESFRLFVMNVTFFVTLDPSINVFSLQTGLLDLKSNSKYDNILGEFIYNNTALNHVNEGPIPPYQSNMSLSVFLNQWPPFSQGDVSHMLDFADKFDIYPTLPVSFEWSSYQDGDLSKNITSFGYLEVDFNLTNYNPIKVYRFNLPPTLWLIYGFTIPTIIVTPIYLLRKWSRGKTIP